MARPSLRLAAWLAALVSAMCALLTMHRPLHPDPSITPVLEVFWIIREGAIVVGVYLLATTVLGALSRVCNLATMTNALDYITVSSVRQLLVLVTAASVAGTGVAGAGTAANEPPPVLVRLPPDQPAPPPPVLRRLEDPGQVAPPIATPSNVPTASVAAGGNLWVLAEDTLRSSWAREPKVSEVAPYWRTLIERNRSRLAHADDPDLVYAGQTFELPPVPPAR